MENWIITDGGEVVCDSQRRPIAVMDNAHFTLDQVCAHAKFIAAAPVMYEALKYAKHFIEHLADYGITVTNANSPKSFIEAAIKAAEGKG